MPHKPHRSGFSRFEIAQVLEDAILGGEFRPGDRLPEMRIAQEMGVSQASVREALQDLESRGLVVKYPNRGSSVIDLSSQDLVQMYQIRRALEPLAGGLAATHMSNEALIELHACVEAMRIADGVADLKSFSRADIQFHRLIWSQQPNRYLERSLQTISMPLFAFDLIRRNPSSNVNYDRAIRQHHVIYQALRSRDATLVVRVLDRMNQQWLRQDLKDYERLRATEPAHQPRTTVQSLSFLRKTH